MNLQSMIFLLTIYSLMIFVRLIHSDSIDVHIDEENSTSINVEQFDDRDEMTSEKHFQTNFLFLGRAKSTELIAGELTRLLIGTRNRANEDLLVESIEGSIRYPVDFSYFIQNFTSLRPLKVIPSGFESTFEYLFVPSETFAGRSMGFVILLHLRDKNGKQYENVVFNETMNFLEMEHQFDGETFSLYLLFIGFVIVVGFLLYQYLFNSHWKRNQGKSTSNSNREEKKGNYDLDWIPKHHLISNRSTSNRRKNEKKIRSNQIETNELNQQSIGSSTDNDQ